MLELVSYGLTGLTAMLVVASCCAFSSEFYLPKKRAINLTNKALELFYRRSGERSTGTIYRDVLSRSVPGVTLHG